MSINFCPQAYGTALTQRVERGLPTLGVKESTWILILVRNIVINYFKDLQRLFAFVSSSVACALTIAALIRDIPTIFTLFEQISSLGAASIWTAQSRAAFMTHMISGYLWPIAVNLLRGFFLTVVGAVAVSAFSIPFRYYKNIQDYNAQRVLAVDHVRKIQLIANEILKLIPKQDPKAYLNEALRVFDSEQQDKAQLVNAVLRRIDSKSEFVKTITERECTRLKSTVERQLRSLSTAEAYAKLTELFTGQTSQEGERWATPNKDASSDEAPINQFIARTLRDSLDTGRPPKDCLELLIDGFKEQKFEGGTLQLLTCLRLNPTAFQVAALYQKLMTHETGYKTAVKEMQTIYGFEEPPLKIDSLWQ